MNYRIQHKDIADLGYYFLENEQEEKYLEIINDELAQRIGREAIKHLSYKHIKDLSVASYEEMNTYLRENIEGLDEMVVKIRNEYLLEIKNKRKSILIRDNV